jgi:hypothetical protein
MPRPDIIMVRQLAVASQNVAFPLVDQHRTPVEQERDALTALDHLDRLSQRIRRELGGEAAEPVTQCPDCQGTDGNHFTGCAVAG